MKGGWIKEYRVENDDAHSKMKLEFDIIMKRAPCYRIRIFSTIIFINASSLKRKHPR